MTLFLRILCLLLVLSGACYAQNQSIVAAGTEIKVTRQKWERGVYRRLSAPTMTARDNIWQPLPRGIRGYYYQADFINGPGLKVKGIVWEYVFVDPSTKKEIGRHKFVSKVSIDRNETDTVTAFLTRPPSLQISAGALDEEDKKKQYIEHIEIKAVMLSDDTMWKAPATSANDIKRLMREVKKGRIFS